MPLKYCRVLLKIYEFKAKLSNINQTVKGGEGVF